MNVWGFMTVDAERGILYMPVAAPAWDRYGGDRRGENLFGSSSSRSMRHRKAPLAFSGRPSRHLGFRPQAPPMLFDVRGRPKDAGGRHRLEIGLFSS